jgi:hypothetical protein
MARTRHIALQMAQARFWRALSWLGGMFVKYI